jgi:hypothetical protein
VHDLEAHEHVFEASIQSLTCEIFIFVRRT